MKMFPRVLALLAAGFLSFAVVTHAQDAKPKLSVSGQVIAVDTATKSIKIKSKEGEETVKYEDGTKFEISKPATIEDIKEGDEAKVNGALAEDQTSIDATLIECLRADTKIPAAVRTFDKSVIGKLSKEGDHWSIAVADKKIAVKTNEKTKVKVRENAKVEDVTAGKAISTMLKKGTPELTAARVQLPNG
jgi:hypothetical protein